MTEKELTEREKYVYLAKLAEQAERYDEMHSYMKKVAHLVSEGLVTDERNLLSVSYKNSVGARRASWRIVSSVEQKEQAKPNPHPHRIQLAVEYKKKIEAELLDICNDILKLLLEMLIPKTEHSESQVFFHKMSGDYYRYISEFAVDKREDYADKANDAYEKATEVAHRDLPPTHPIRLGLALNFSVFHYEIRGNSEAASGMAQKAFDYAITDLDNVADESYKDATLIMQLLRDNLTLWATDCNTEAEQKA